ncbi:HNH endonuclease [Flavobacterium piscinae]|nr:HNH endonuclease [Flavobacterium piscinae]MBC8884062.1 HNH endonuclease [Flavobacterium piscinae]
MDYFKKRKKEDDATEDVLRKLSEIEELKRIDDAIEKLNITISVPKNTLNALESLKKIESILLKLKNKKPPKIFDPNKEALKKLGIKLPKSKNGVSVDFENTSYLYPSTGNQKNIVKIKMTGSRRLDDKLAYELSGIKKDKNYTWHHLDDYDPMTNTCSMQLVNLEIHVKTYPHFGSVELIKRFFNLEKY